MESADGLVFLYRLVIALWGLLFVYRKHYSPIVVFVKTTFSSAGIARHHPLSILSIIYIFNFNSLINYQAPIGKLARELQYTK